MPDVFLSYSREDQATARRFAGALQREGFDVWWDQTLHTGDPYDQVTEQALRSAKAVVVLWSKASVASRWVRAEATIADRKGTLLPVMIGACERPVMFELTQAPELAHWKGDTGDKAWRGFVDDVRRFIARGEVAGTAPGSAPGAPPPRRLRFRLALAAGLLALLGTWAWSLYAVRDQGPEPGSKLAIAVLPFVDRTGTGQYAALGEGLADELSNWLRHLPDLSVRDYHSAAVSGSKDRDIRRIARELGVAQLVQGSVRHREGIVRVGVQLVSGKDGRHLWSDTFDLPDSDALRIEDTISRRVADALNARLPPEAELRWRARQSTEPEARGLYFEGRAQFRRRTPESNLRAQELFRRAIKADTAFAIAYVSLAEATLNGIRLNDSDPAAVAVEVTPLLQKALQLSPEMPEALTAQGLLAIEVNRPGDALPLLERSLQLNPNDADTQRRMGMAYERLADPRRAIGHYDMAVELDPLEAVNHLYRCLSLQDMARYAEAEGACAKARELDAANHWGSTATAWLASARGDLATALQWIDRAAALAPLNVDVVEQRMEILLALQRPDAARDAAASLPASAEPARSLLLAKVAVERRDLPVLKSLTAALAARGNLDATHLRDLAGLQLAGGDVPAARDSLARARASNSWDPQRLVRPSYVRNGHAGALTVAAVEQASGDQAGALRTLDALDGMLATMTAAGAEGSGLHWLRAQSLALRGDADGAMQELQRAHELGWRLSQRARTLPQLHELQPRADLRALLAQVDRQVQSAAD